MQLRQRCQKIRKGKCLRSAFTRSSASWTKAQAEWSQIRPLRMNTYKGQGFCVLGWNQTQGRVARARTLEAGERWARLAQARAASRPGLCAIAPGRRAGAPPLWQLARSFPVTGPQPLSSLRRAGNRASRPGHRALARSSLLRDWFPCAGSYKK